MATEEAEAGCVESTAPALSTAQPYLLCVGCKRRPLVVAWEAGCGLNFPLAWLGAILQCAIHTAVHGDLALQDVSQDLAQRFSRTRMRAHTHTRTQSKTPQSLRHVGVSPQLPPV